MAKQQMYQRYIFKIHSQDILRAKNRNISITVDEGRKMKYIITLADSQVLRFIDDINNVDRESQQRKYKSLIRELKTVRREKKTSESKTKIKEIYKKLEEIQLVNEYLCIIMDRPDDIVKLGDGFTFNGKTFKRMVGTPNGVKKSIVVYTSLWDELNVRLNNGRNLENPLVPAKFEAYKALACSASIPVSYPKGVVVVTDLEYTFKADIMELRDNPGGEPILEQKNTDVGITVNDGYGLMCPELAERWGNELKLNYLMSGCCIRNAFLKGMSFTFDFHKFAQEIASKETIIDAWGNEHNVNDIELVLSTSMLKLWDSYKNWEDYYENCIRYGYTFAVTKVTPKILDNVRTLNYQFIQSYELSDSDIYDLISPTMNEIKSVLHENVDKAILFLRGLSVNKDNVLADLNDDYVKALMINDNMLNDPYVIDHINTMINRRINDAKIGVIGVTGNFQILSVDPYAFCEHIFGLIEDTSKCGLLKEGEIYSHFWTEKGEKSVVAFRAPMICHNNIRKLSVNSNDNVKEWFKYMPTVAILNCHDTTTHTLCGADCDGDLIYTTNNNILLKNTEDVLPLVCVQRKSEKHIITEDMLLKSNMLGFGDEIGTITNRATAMFDVRSQFDENSEEYKVLTYRIMSTTHLQQGAIDKIKSIITEPMPTNWYIPQRIDYEKDDSETIEKKKFLNSICVNKKPYFMNYVYNEQKAKYNRFVKNSNICGLFDCRKNIDELRKKSNPTQEESDFLKYYDKFFPVFDGNCVMNRLCHMVEKEFDGYTCYIKKNSSFDYSILKCDTDYSQADYNSIKKLYKEYLKEYESIRPHNHTQSQKEEFQTKLANLNEQYRKKCIETCTNEYELCNIVLDICYTTNKAKNFAWEMCGSTIIDNLLKQNNYELHYLEADENGNVEYQGQRFSRKAITLNKEDDEYADNE